MSDVLRIRAANIETAHGTRSGRRVGEWWQGEWGAESGGQTIGASTLAEYAVRLWTEGRGQFFASAFVEELALVKRTIRVPGITSPAWEVVFEAESGSVGGNGFDAFVSSLATAFESEPFEDGYGHAAEEIIRAAIEVGDEGVECVESAIFCTRRVAMAAHTLQCVGRLEAPVSEEWRAQVIARALRCDALDLRDAAMQAAEAWGGTCIRVLSEHEEPVAWLRGYAAKIIRQGR